MTDQNRIIRSLSATELRVLTMIAAAGRFKETITRQSASAVLKEDPFTVRNALDRLVQLNILATSRGRLLQSVYSVMPAFVDVAAALLAPDIPAPISLSAAAKARQSSVSFDDWLNFLRGLQKQPRTWGQAGHSKTEPRTLEGIEPWFELAFWLGLAVSDKGQVKTTPHMPEFLAASSAGQTAQLLWVVQQKNEGLKTVLAGMCRYCKPGMWYSMREVNRFLRVDVKTVNDLVEIERDNPLAGLSGLATVGLVLLTVEDGQTVISMSPTLLRWWEAGATMPPPPIHHRGDSVVTLVLQSALKLETWERNWSVRANPKSPIPMRIATVLAAMNHTPDALVKINQTDAAVQAALQRMLAADQRTLDADPAMTSEAISILERLGLVYRSSNTSYSLTAEAIPVLQQFFAAKSAARDGAEHMGDTVWIRNDELLIHSSLLLYLLQFPESNIPGQPEPSLSYLAALIEPTVLSEYQYKSWVTQFSANHRLITSSYYPQPQLVNVTTTLAFLKRHWKQRHSELLQYGSTPQYFGIIPANLAALLLSYSEGAWLSLRWLNKLFVTNPTQLMATNRYGSTVNEQQAEVLVKNALFGPLLWLGLLELAADEQRVQAVRVTPLGREMLPRLGRKSPPKFDDETTLPPRVTAASRILSIENHPKSAALIYHAARLGRVLHIGATWEIELAHRVPDQPVNRSHMTELQDELRLSGVQLTFA